MEKILFTSESVTEGHPDKMCDAISDAILDALMEKDPMSRVACETATTTGLVLVMGEITTKANVDIQKIVRDTIREIGYDNADYGFDADTCAVITVFFFCFGINTLYFPLEFTVVCFPTCFLFT